MTKLKEITKLKGLLRSEGYDKILVWDNGTWALATSGYNGEQDGETPVRVINRVHNTNLTYKQIDELVKEIKTELVY